MKEYAVIYEHGPNNWSAYPPDLPGCAATGDTLDECKRTIAEAILFHIEGLQMAGYEVPEPSSLAAMVSVA